MESENLSPKKEEWENLSIISIPDLVDSSCHPKKKGWRHEHNFYIVLLSCLEASLEALTFFLHSSFGTFFRHASYYDIFL